jgi:hypothetical protein
VDSWRAPVSQPRDDAMTSEVRMTKSEATPSHHHAHLVDGPAPGHAEGQGAGELDEANDLAHQCVLSATTVPKEPRWMVRVRAERRATHYAGRETAPRGSGDKYHNASGSV